MRVDQSAYELRRATAAALALVAKGDPQAGTGPDVRAIHALLAALRDSALAVRAEAIQSLIALGPPAEPADLDGERKSLMNRIPGENDPAQKIWLRVLLMRLDPSAIKVNMPLVVKELSNSKLRGTAAEALGMMGKEAKVALADLQKGVNSLYALENLPFVAMCIWALCQLEGDALPALDDIKKWVTHKDPAVKNFAQEAVNRTQKKKN